VTPRPVVQLLDLLGELAGHAGQSEAVDEKLSERLEMLAGVLRDVADELDRQARRAKGEAARHGADEQQLADVLRRLQPAERLVRERHELENRPPARLSTRQLLSSPERNEVEQYLRKHPQAGRPAIAAATGLSDWRVRRYLADRASQTGEVAAESQ
jgi:hypothetical protein